MEAIQPTAGRAVEHPRSGLRAAAQRARLEAKAMSSALSVGPRRPLRRHSLTRCG